MVPILIKVQQLQRRLIDQPDDFGTAWNWVDTFLRLKYHDQPAIYRFLRQALLSRRVLPLTPRAATDPAAATTHICRG